MTESQTTPDHRLSSEWIADCLKWRKRWLKGRYAHWCFEWDGLPIDETTLEWPCGCGRDADEPLERIE